MAIILDGSGSGGLKINSGSKGANVELVDASGNAILYNKNDQPAAPVGLLGFGRNDETMLPVRVDRLGSMGQAAFMPTFFDSFDGVTVSPDRYFITSTSMVAAQSTAGGIQFNSGNITTASTGYLLSTFRRFNKLMKSPLFGRFRARFDWQATGSIMEVGFGDASASTGVNANGAYFQVTNTGVLQPVVSYNGTDITGTGITYSTTAFYILDIWIDDDAIVFTVQDSNTGLIISRQNITLPLTAVRFWAVTGVQGMMHQYQTTAPSAASKMYVSDVCIGLLDALIGKSAPHVHASAGRNTWANPSTGAQLHQWANSAEPTSATLLNTAASYTTLGGKFQFAAVAGAVTDYALFGFTVPTPFNLAITGVTIDAWNTGAAVATTPSLLTWALAVNSTAVSLATATALRVPLGSQSFPVAAAIGANVEQINKQFQSPIVVGGGRFLHVVLRMPVGTATASQVLAGMVGFEGYFF